MFNTIMFWCEFPNKTNWKKINRLITFKTEIYLACSSLKEFLKYKKQIKNKNINLGVWPTCSKLEGYWFSGYSGKKTINRLENFKGFPTKIDIEPPIFKNPSWHNYIAYFFQYFIFSKGKNNEYLKNKISLLKQGIIISTFPFPKFLLKRIGYFKSSHRNNFFVYTSLLPKMLKPLAKIYYKYFIKSKLKQNPGTMFAIGCTGPGIFGNEMPYKNINEFQKDLEFVYNLNVKNLVIFEISSLSNKPDAEEWFDLILTYIKK